MNKDAKRIGIFGRSGSGKSTHLKERIEGNKRIVVFDPQLEYKQIRGFKVCSTLVDLRNAMRKNWSKGFKLVYNPASGREKEALHKLSWLLVKVQKPYFEGKQTQEITLVVEELNLSFPLNLKDNFSGFREICSRGRHHGIEVFGVSQGIAEVNMRFRRNYAELIFFAQQDHADITTTCKSLGSEYREKIRNLKPHEYIKFSDGKAENGKNRCDWRRKK